MLDRGGPSSLSARIACVATAVAALLGTSDCHKEHREQPPPAPPTSALPSPVAGPAEPARLPEDPAAGKRAEEQWRQHLAHEERERQLGFDRRHLRQHRAIVGLIAAARRSYDQARTPAAVERAAARMPARLAAIRRQVAGVDHWGVNSHLLADYAALEDALEHGYPAAKRAASSRSAGDSAAPDLERIRADFDRHMRAIAAWLDEASAIEPDEGQ